MPDLSCPGLQGAPSLVQGGGAVGATDLLSGPAGEVLLTDISASPVELAGVVEQLLQQRGLLRDVGFRGAVKARSWDEAANAADLVGMVQHALAREP
jgi:hypothetical protein